MTKKTRLGRPRARSSSSSAMEANHFSVCADSGLRGYERGYSIEEDSGHILVAGRPGAESDIRLERMQWIEYSLKSRCGTSVMNKLG